MTTIVARRRAAAALGAFTVAAGMLLVSAHPAEAGVTGGCTGSADFNTDTAPAYTPDNDTRGNPVVVPKDDGTIVAWAGSVPGENKGFGGKVEIRLGPAWIEVADWGEPDHDGTNADDQRSDSGDYNMDEVWDVIPKNLVHGIYEARASHDASGVDCDAQFFVKFEGNALSSPLVLGAIVVLAGALYALFMSGRRRAVLAFFKGRPVLGVIVGLLGGVTIALLLQQFGVWPLDNLTVIILPLAAGVIGIIIAKVAPFGGASAPAPLADLDAPPGSDQIFADGFESGDTSAWTEEP